MKHPINTTLSQIVEQSGGTVTNKDNRCKLLQDWLDSVSTVTRFAPKFDGVATYIDLSQPLFIRDGDTISFWMQMPAGGVATEQYIISHTEWSNALTFLIDSNGEIFVGRCTALVDDVALTEYPTDGLPHRITLTGESFGAFARVGCDPVFGRVADAKIWDFVIIGSDQGALFELPLNESFAEYPLLTGTNGLTATAYNFVESDVVKVPA